MIPVSTRSAGPITPLLLVISGLFVATLVTSNIIAVKVVTVTPLGFTHLPGIDHTFTVTGAIVIFPLAYLFGDVLTEVWGFGTARLVIWTGFACNAVVVGFVAAAVALPSAPSFPYGDAYSRVLGLTPRLVAASFAAYLAGEFLNAYVLARLKLATRGRLLWLRTTTSTVFGQGVDSVIFVTLAFAGVLPGSVLLEIIRDLWILKIFYEIAATPLTYGIVTFLKHHERVDAFDVGISFAPVVLRGRGPRDRAEVL